jgi:hypothetical protein
MLHWFIEYSDDQCDCWTFADGTIPLLRSRRSRFIYYGQDHAIVELLRALPSRGLPEDVGPIPKACAIVSGTQSDGHSWLTPEELLALPTTDDGFLRVVESILFFNRSRVLYWFTADSSPIEPEDGANRP